jgi:hypothetical protein
MEKGCSRLSSDLEIGTSHSLASRLPYSSGRGILNPIAKLTKRDVTTCQRISGFPLQTRMVRHRERHLGSRNERTT